MGDEVEVLIDESGQRWRVGRTLGAGGQGEVKLLSDGEHAAKLVLAPPGGRAELEKRIRAVRRLDLEGLDVARPLRLLAPPTVGYVMRFLRDMVPLSSLHPVAGENVLQRWLDTGGLLRRSRLLAHAGEVLHDLHSRGYVYGDVSPSNVFVSEGVAHDEAWLIDPDNIGPASTARPLYTPGYCAPELLRQERYPDALTDAHAYAVLVYVTLTGRHPWIGDEIADAEPELEDQAHAGAFAFVDDPADASNRSSAGLPAGWVLTKRLLELARKTFSEARKDRTRRPSVSDWVAALHEQADLCVDCPACGMTVRPSNEFLCWACDERLPHMMEFELIPWHPDAYGGDMEAPGKLRHIRQGAGRRVRCAAGGKAVVNRRLAEFLTGRDGRKEVLELTVDKTARLASVRLRAGKGTLLWKSLSGERSEALGTRPREIKPGEAILLGPPGAEHTLVRLGSTAVAGGLR